MNRRRPPVLWCLLLAVVVALAVATYSEQFDTVREQPQSHEITATSSARSHGPVVVLTRDPVRVWTTQRAQRVSEISFSSTAGEVREVAARIQTDLQTSSTTRQTGVLLQLTCVDTGGHRRTSQSITNVERGGRAVQEPRLLYVTQSLGQVRCDVSARLYAEGADNSRIADQVTVTRGSSLAASAPLPSWSREWTRDHPVQETYRSSLTRPGEAWAKVPDRVVELPQGLESVAVQSDHKVTVCFWRGGSSDATTPIVTAPDGHKRRQDLCAADPSTPGALVRSRVTMTRLTEDGRACASPVAALDERFWVGGRQHHARLNANATVVLPTPPGCTQRVRVRTWLENVPLDAGRSLDVVVHAPDERLAVLAANRGS